jgi:fused signal recognition particle receptor
MTNVFSRWKAGLAKTSKSKFGQIATILGVTEITPETWDDLEALLIQADLGIDTTNHVLDKLENRVDREGITKSQDLIVVLRKELRNLLVAPPELVFTEKPSVILIVGVNGSGKTTTIAKLGNRFKNQGKRVLLGAADTFRAAAVDQLEIWSNRLDIPIIVGQPGGDPGAVAYDTVHSGINRNMDMILIDTAGRLHTRFNLMEELKKVSRVVGKALPGSPHAVWLVMDATTGQNGLQQAHAFKEAVDVSGVILAKLDSSARGGMTFAIYQDLNIPIIYAGLGEKPEDLQPFDPDAFIDGILAEWN